MDGTPTMTVVGGEIAGKRVFGNGNGPERSVWWVAEDLL